MLIFKIIPALKSHLNKIKNDGKQIGFVPTMGALHEGHLSLVRKSIISDDCTVVSIFLNPTQFNNPRDLKTYPSDIERDIKLLESLNGNIILFNPNSTDLYSGNIKTDFFDFNGLDNHMEGKFRGDHFQGVATVVRRLFKIINSDNVYFGEKDFQQIRIIENLISDAKINNKVIRCETIREDNGLALSSRNKKLDFSSKKIASNLFKALNFAKENFGTLGVLDIEKNVVNLLSKFPTIKLDYFVIADEQHLIPANLKETNKKYRAFIAAYISGVRLIDNIKLY